MVEGSPLHYYSRPHRSSPAHYTSAPHFNSPACHFFGRFDLHTNMSEDMLMPQSPSSTQSDSENSISSIEVSPSPKPIQRTKASIKCCWRSCSASFDSLDQLASHVSKVHAASGPGGLFYCGWEGCTRNDRGFNARYKMLVHVRTHTNEKPHQCFQCDKSFSRAENLKIHTRSHSGEKPYVCPVVGCGKAYSNSSDRFKHTRTHQVDKPYQCKVPGCPKRYTDPSSLRKHVKTYKHFAPRPDGGCGCKRDCCVSTCLTRAAELLKLGAYIELGGGEIGKWNNLLGPFIGEPKEMFASYQVDIDGPLDLSTSRKNKNL